MEKELSQKLKNFDKVWQRVLKQRAAGKTAQPLPKKKPPCRNTRFHGGGR